MTQRKSLKFYGLTIVLVTLVSIIFYSCYHKPTPAEIAASDSAEGKLLTEKYCTSCHMRPDPSLIDKATWEKGVLPAMAQKMGLDQYEGQYFANARTGISIAEWAKILAYYKTEAPSKLVFPKPVVQPVNDWAIFSLKTPQKINKTERALTTLVSFNPNDNKIYSGDATNNLYTWDANLKQELYTKMPSAATGVIFDKTSANKNLGIFTCIGMLQPIDVSKGKVLVYNLDNKGAHATAPVTMADSLPRPVQTVAADFNKDGLTDYAVCGFGHDRGGLYWLKQQPDHHFKTYPIKMVSGGTQLITGDFNNDGWPDLMCLFAQADEGIWMFLNNHHGGFDAVNILRFPPIYGSSSFQLIDFNHDGKPDILYTAGDNSDYSRVLKPYHGVYIFLNDGNYHFKQKYFYHINGCTKAVASDFKKTGKLDIAVISFFADYKDHPSEGFMFLEQTTPFKFIPHELPIGKYGRWLTMAVDDTNKDGFPDIILGNFAMGGGLINQKDFKPAWDINEPLIVLENNFKSK
jgi:hypothetical protein